MPWKISIDNGSTFTDGCLFTENGIWSAKVLTTPYDLMSCFVEVFRSLARLAGLPNENELLRRVEEVRYSTTAGTNALLVRKGIRVGLIVEPQAMETVYGLRQEASELLETLIADRIAGFPVSELPSAEVDRLLLAAVRDLLKKGAQWIAVSLPGPRGGQVEQELKRRYMRHLPGHLLGAVPVIFSRELCVDPDDARRTATTVLNAFLHKDMARFLYHADNWLRERHVAQPMRIMRNDQGCGRVAKTTAVKTLDSGPMGGLLGAAALSRACGVRQGITMDVGGTSTDIGLLHEQRPVTDLFGHVHQLPISFSFPALRSEALGGGSVFRVEGKQIQIGPESAGALPGPACFGRGGDQPTLTDAVLMAGYIEPATFAGGSIALRSDLAENAILEKISKRLGLSGASEGARVMVDAFAGRVAQAVKEILARRSLKPAETAMVCYGGSGPLMACLVAEQVGIRDVIIPAQCASFSALGVAFSELAHEYRVVTDRSDCWREALRDVQERASRDMYGEGVPVAEYQATLWLRAGGGSGRQIQDLDEVAEVARDATGALVFDYRVAKNGSGLTDLHQPGTRAAAQPRSRSRNALFGDTYQAIEVVDADALRPHDSGAGPGVLESQYWSAVVPGGWKWKVAEYGLRLSA